MDITKLRPDQFSLVNRLVSKAFGYTPPHIFFDDFPIWNFESKSIQHYGIFEGDQLISHVGVRHAQLKTTHGATPISMIGAVATDENFRGRGLSTRLMKHALHEIDPGESPWTILWGSEHQFYGKLGFNLQGKQIRIPLSRLSINPVHAKSSLIQTGVNSKIIHSLISEKIGVSLSSNDSKWIEAHQTIQWYSISEPFAFVAFQRGMDLHHLIHEMGGDRKSMDSLLFHIAMRDPMAEVLGKQEQLQKMGIDSKLGIEEHLCLARPRNQNQKWNDEFWVSGISAC